MALGIRLFATLPEDTLGDRPIADERLLLIADVRLDNRKELSAALGLDAVGMSDRLMLFAAWSRWGVATLDRIVGDFAIAAFDLERRQLILARDPTGQKPLFFSVQKDRIAFASMPCGLFSAERPAPDIGRIAQVLGGFGSHDDRSAFVDIRRVLPGHVVSFRDGREHSSRCYWQPRLDPFEHATTEELVEQYRSLLDAAVQSQTRRTGDPLAAHLSSGFDSTAVTTTATRFVDHKSMVAFTAAPAFDAIRRRPLRQADRRSRRWRPKPPGNMASSMSSSGARPLFSTSCAATRAIIKSPSATCSTRAGGAKSIARPQAAGPPSSSPPKWAI